jgi:hypothetical protein
MLVQKHHHLNSHRRRWVQPRPGKIAMQEVLRILLVPTSRPALVVVQRVEQLEPILLRILLVPINLEVAVEHRTRNPMQIPLPGRRRVTGL